jgi:predicted CDP-diglyceride synthetase/phosphatidate cytidylyltransferase
MKYWWAIMALTVISFVATAIASFIYYALIDYDCLSSFLEYSPRCTEDHAVENMALANIDVARGAFDLFTDILSKLARPWR